MPVHSHDEHGADDVDQDRDHGGQVSEEQGVDSDGGVDWHDADEECDDLDSLQEDVTGLYVSVCVCMCLYVSVCACAS
jgi:hypothetical protein